jgi:hypothetical protein
VKDPTVKIIVPTGLLLTIDASAIHGCTNMWEGIEVAAGGRIKIVNNSIVEDAKIAVHILGTSITNNSSLLVYEIEEATFNKNEEGLVIENYSEDIGNNGYNNFQIGLAVFTNREIDYVRNAQNTCPTWVPTYSSTSTSLFNDIIINSIDLETPFILNNLQTSPLNNGILKPKNHIHLTKMGCTSGSGPDQANISHLFIGNNDLDPIIFDNAENGILAENSNFTFHMSIFQSCDKGIAAIRTDETLNANATLPFYFFRGLANAGANSQPLVNYGNFFYNNGEDIMANNYTWHFIISAEFRSLQTITGYDNTTWPPVNSNATGKCAININSNCNAKTEILGNRIWNHYQGIYLHNEAGHTYDLTTSPPTVYVYKYFSGVTDINTNKIEDKSPSNNTINYAFCSNAIDADFTMGAGGPGIKWESQAISWNLPIQNPNLTIRSNLINRVFRGAKVSSYNWAAHAVNITDNLLSLRADPNTNLAASEHGFWVNNSYHVFVKGNKVQGVLPVNVNLPFTDYLQNNTLGNRGRLTNYRMDNNFKQVITCNESNRGSFGFEFNGPASVADTRWIQGNKMQLQHYVQFLLNNGALIGAQPFGGLTPMGNTFANASGGLSQQTYTYATPAVQSSIYVTAGGATEPIINDADFPPQKYSTTFIPQSIFTITSLPINGCANAPVIGNTIAYASGTDDLLKKAIGFTHHKPEFDELGQFYYYNLLCDDSSYLASTPYMQTFFDSVQAPSSKLKALQDIKDAIITHDFMNAYSLLANFAPHSAMQINYHNFYALLLKHTEAITPLDSLDLIDLLQLAKKCPHIDGLCVYDARVLYNKIGMQVGNSYTPFTDVCNDVNNYKQTNHTASNRFDAVLSPNPTNANFYISANAPLKTIKYITDVLGKQQFFKQNVLSETEYYIETSLPSGLYFVTIINANNEKVINKLHIN